MNLLYQWCMSSARMSSRLACVFPMAGPGGCRAVSSDSEVQNGLQDTECLNLLDPGTNKKRWHLKITAANRIMARPDR